MSLTADQITAKNFEEYHKRILPFLNGNFPTPIVNKFSKGDLYSTDEKIIGQWIDGKPLYQKTITGTTPSSLNTFQNVEIGASVDFGYCTIFTVLGSNGSFMQMESYADVSVLNSTHPTRPNTFGYRITKENNALSRPFRAVMFYTKTTDSPISIGDGNDYSADEQVVGSWIDGKPIYQKTVNTGGLPNSTTKSVAHGISNLKYITQMDGVARRTSDNEQVPIPVVYANDTIASQVKMSCDNTNIKLKCTVDMSVYNQSYVTLRYTKTTD